MAVCKSVRFGRQQLPYTADDRAAFEAGNYGEARAWMTKGLLIETWRDLGLSERVVKRMRNVNIAFGINEFPSMPQVAAEAYLKGWSISINHKAIRTTLLGLFDYGKFDGPTYSLQGINDRTHN